MPPQIEASKLSATKAKVLYTAFVDSWPARVAWLKELEPSLVLDDTPASLVQLFSWVEDQQRAGALTWPGRPSLGPDWWPLTEAEDLILRAQYGWGSDLIWANDIVALAVGYTLIRMDPTVRWEMMRLPNKSYVEHQSPGIVGGTQSLAVIDFVRGGLLTVWNGGRLAPLLGVITKYYVPVVWE